MAKQSKAASSKKRKVTIVKKGSKSPRPIKALANSSCEHPPTVDALTASYNHEIRPLLDAFHRLRNLKVMQDGIQLPTIVVVGDQSSGKSSVLESLAGISLPRGQGICTRVPLIMRLQDDPSVPSPTLHLEYNDKNIHSSETDIASAIQSATNEIAGGAKGISDTPITLVVRKKGVPDLTMVDLPGITRVPVRGQPENIYEQITGIIMQYIKPAESIILNVLSASVDFSTCESIRMSRQVDPTGERTLAVVTKADKSPEGLLEKVDADDVNIGLGYVCVRNRIGSETYEKARESEEKLFMTHHLLSRIDKSIVGIPVLAQKLMRIQAQWIAKCLPNVVKDINEKLNFSISELEGMPQNLASNADAMRASILIVSRAKEMLKKLLVRGEFEDYPNENKMHGTARLAEMLGTYKNNLPADFPTKGGFLMEEIAILEEARCIGLPNFLSKTAFLTLLQMKVKEISGFPHDFVLKAWSYVEYVVLRVLEKETENYPSLQACTRSAAQNLLEKMRRKSRQAVKEILEMEMLTDYTCSHDFMETWRELMDDQEAFLEVIEDHSKPTKINIGKIGMVDVSHLRGKHEGLAEQAFDTKMRLISYWNCVVLRLVDVVALHICKAVKNLVDEEFESEIINEVVAGKQNEIEKMLEESPTISGKRERLGKNIQLLSESKEVLGAIMDRISVNSSE